MPTMELVEEHAVGNDMMDRLARVIKRDHLGDIKTVTMDCCAEVE